MLLPLIRPLKPAYVTIGQQLGRCIFYESYYQPDSVEKQASERWKVVQDTHVLMLALEWGNLGERNRHDKMERDWEYKN